MAGSLLCGSSIWIENGRRRGEMALYVLPRAIRTLFPYKWMKSGNRGVRLVERLVFLICQFTLPFIDGLLFPQFCVCRVASFSFNSCCASPWLSQRPLSLDISICDKRSKC